MALTPVSFPDFGGGLNLRDQPDVVDESQAINLLNTTFTDKGAVKSRDGYGLFTSVAGTNRYDSLSPYYTVSGTTQLVAGAGNRLEGLSAAGAIVSSTATTANPHYFVRWGSPSAELVICANGTDALRTWNGAAFATPSYTGTSPTGRFVAIQSPDNRLVCARYTGTTAGSNPSTVRFSAAGDYTTWGANDWVDLTPGDGEAIIGMCTWRELLIVFKPSRMFVFYGNSTSSTGTPVFNYRIVDSKVGPMSSNAITVADDGVYFADRRGVYRTTGGIPDSVSGLLDPFFLGGASDFYTSGQLNQSSVTTASMAWNRNLVFLACATGASTTNNRVLVYSTDYKWWSMYDFPAGAMVSFRPSAQYELLFTLATGTNNIVRHSSNYTTDNGTTISSMWQSGWFDYGNPRVKSIRQAKVWGKGPISYGLAKDYVVGSTGVPVSLTKTSVTWGSTTWGGSTWTGGQSLVPKLVRGIAIRGTVFSVYIANTSATPWSVYRLDNELRAQRTPSVVRTEV